MLQSTGTCGTVTKISVILLAQTTQAAASGSAICVAFVVAVMVVAVIMILSEMDNVTGSTCAGKLIPSRIKIDLVNLCQDLHNSQSRYGRKAAYSTSELRKS